MSTRPFKNGQIIYVAHFGERTLYCDNRNEALQEFLKGKARRCSIWAHPCVEDTGVSVAIVIVEAKTRYRGEFTRADARTALDEGTFNADIPVFEDAFAA